jgi:hypothetical protein
MSAAQICIEVPKKKPFFQDGAFGTGVLQADLAGPDRELAPWKNRRVKP